MFLCSLLTHQSPVVFITTCVFSPALLTLIFCHTCLLLLSCFPGLQLSFCAINALTYVSNPELKALFLTTNWKARGTSFQCKPKFIIFLTKSHFLFLYFLSRSVALPSIHLAEPEHNLIFYYLCTIPQWLVAVAIILQISPVPTLFLPVLLLLS